MEDYDIKAIHRLQIRNNAAAVKMKLNNRDKRMQLLINGRKKKLSANDIGLKASTQSFVNEDTTRQMRALLAVAKQARNAGKILYVWNRDDKGIGEG